MLTAQERKHVSVVYGGGRFVQGLRLLPETTAEVSFILLDRLNHPYFLSELKELLFP